MLKFGPGDKSRGRAEGCLWICLGVLRPNPRATGQIESRPRNQLSDWLLIKIAKFAQLAALCLPGIATEQLSERFPTFVLSMHVGSSEKAPKRKFEHW